MPDFDAIVIGTGQAGPSLAFRLAGAGMKVAVVERQLVGGTCVNTGCTPTKALVASAYAARIARRAAEYGVVIGGDIGVDMRRVKARKDAIVAASRDGLTSGVENTANITLYRGHARFASPQAVEIAGEGLRAGRIFITDLHQCRRASAGAANARHKRSALPGEFVDNGRRFSAGPSHHCRRQLYRP